MRLTFEYMTIAVNVFNQGKLSRDMDNQTFKVNHIENLASEHSEEIELETECRFELEFENFNLDQIVESAAN